MQEIEKDNPQDLFKSIITNHNNISVAPIEGKQLFWIITFVTATGLEPTTNHLVRKQTLNHLPKSECSFMN